MLLCVKLEPELGSLKQIYLFYNERAQPVFFGFLFFFIMRVFFVFFVYSVVFSRGRETLHEYLEILFPRNGLCGNIKVTGMIYLRMFCEKKLFAEDGGLKYFVIIIYHSTARGGSVGFSFCCFFFFLNLFLIVSKVLSAALMTADRAEPH